MKTGIVSLFCSMVLWISTAQAQTISPSVISSSGGFYTSANAMLSATVAEMTMVETFTASGSILTQGFQQSDAVSVDVPEIQLTSGDASIYPNPTNGQFVLTFSSDKSENSQIRIYDLLGQLMFTKTVMQTPGNNSVYFDISIFKQGIYLLELTHEENGAKQAKFYKINLVY